ECRAQGVGAVELVAQAPSAVDGSADDAVVAGLDAPAEPVVPIRRRRTVRRHDRRKTIRVAPGVAGDASGDAVATLSETAFRVVRIVVGAVGRELHPQVVSPGT